MFLKFFLRYPARILKKIFSLFGYRLDITYSKKNHQRPDLLNLNIGAGGYIIENFKSLDFYSEHYYPNKEKFLKNRIEYDLRNDKIPFENESVDNIYASHIIEHIEDKFVFKFISESFRVLKPNGVLRIVCPDAKFLFNISGFANHYWYWRKIGSFSNKERYETNWDTLEQYDYLIREFSTPNCRFYNNKIIKNFPSIKELKELNYNDFKDILKKDLKFRNEHPGDHINIHDFESLYNTGILVGFSKVIESKKNGSVSIVMQGDEFDKTSPQMSLYVDMIK